MIATTIGTGDVVLDAVLVTVAALILGGLLLTVYKRRKARKRQDLPPRFLSQEQLDLLTSPTVKDAVVAGIRHELELRRAAPTRCVCLGPKEQSIAHVLERMAEAGREDLADTVLARAGAYGVKTSDQLIAALVQHGEDELARTYHTRFCRAGCGYDLRELFIQYPLDGEEHEAPCPKCGRRVEWVAAKSEA